ncbi:MAG: nitrous oxide reductase family maturation protein NosD, partial [Candidatus Bipolaricaulia bacterium]
MSRSLTVSPGESLQAAIERAAEGAVLSLAAGRWEESLRITKSLTLRGAGQEETLIEGREEGWPTVWISAAGRVTVRIEGLGIAGARGGCIDWPRGICADGLLVQGPAEVKIIDSAVSGNRRSGLFLRGAARVEVIDSVICENGHYGLWLMDSARATIEGSTISENGRGPADGLDSARDGIAVRGSARAEVSQSIISE